MKNLIKKNKPLIKQFGIFVFGGGVNFILNIGLTYLLTDVFHVYYLLSFAIVQAIIIIYGFVYNTFLTFRLKKASSWVFVKFITFLHIFALVNILLVRFFTNVVGMQYLISIVTTIFVTITFRFLLYKKYVFTDDNSIIKKIITTNYRSIILAAGLFLVALFVYGFIPGLYLDDLSAHYLMSANTDCQLNQGLFSPSYCHNFGYPHGYPFLMGLPFVYTSAIIAKIFFINSYLANIITGIIFILASYIGTILLLKKLKVNPYLSVIFSFLWLINPIVFQQASYHYLMYGFALLPAYMLIDLVAYQKIKQSRNYKNYIIWSGILIVARSFAMFMDGYSFIISGLASLIIQISKSLFKKYTKESILKIFTAMILANITAIILYKFYTGTTGGYSIMPLDFFRAQGVDLVTLFIPNSIYWWAGILKIGYNWGDNAFAYSFWGDGGNLYFSYLGISLISVFVTFFFSKFKKSITTKSIILVGIIALIFSFGPSLKINDTRPAVDQSTIAFEDYLMPTDQATFNLPHQYLYLFTPGINNMRAIHRWLLLFKLTLLIVAAVFLSQLIKQKKYKNLAIILTALIFIESFPNINYLHQRHTNNLSQLNAFQSDIIDNLKNHLNEGEVIYFVSEENDFLANYIAAQLNVNTYNTGVDKNQKIAEQYWPEEIGLINSDDNFNQSTYQALSSGLVDKIIYPYFNLRWNAYAWPPSQSDVSEAKDNFDRLIDDPNGNLEIENYQYYSIITLK